MKFLKNQAIKKRPIPWARKCTGGPNERYQRCRIPSGCLQIVEDTQIGDNNPFGSGINIFATLVVVFSVRHRTMTL